MKTLIFAIDVGETKFEWEARAMQMQIADYFQKNKTIPEADNVILFPIKGDMKIFWLEGDPKNLQDVKDLEEIRDKIKPVLEVAMGIKINPKIIKP